MRYTDYPKLTSVHLNCEDSLLLTSGYRPVLGLYDLGTGQMLRELRNVHQGHVNVVKFAYTTPNLFVSSSFDRSFKLWDTRDLRVRHARTRHCSCHHAQFEAAG